MSRRGVWEAYVVACLAAAALACEIYLRRAAPQVVPEARPVQDVVDRESGLLIVHTAKGKRLAPNLHVTIRHHAQSKRDVSIRTNSMGLRGEELPKEKAKGEFRIAVLGDSIVFADAVDADKLFVRLAQDRLRRKPGFSSLRMINMGVPDAGTKEEVDLLEEKARSIRPDLVVLAFYLNDSRPPQGFSGELGTPGWLRRHSLLADLLYQRFKLWKWLQTMDEDRFEWVRWDSRLDWENDRSQFLRLASLAKYDWGAAWREDSWGEIEKEFGRLKDLSKIHQFDVAVVCFPVAFQALAKYVEDAPQKKVESLARGFGFRYLDLLPAFRAARNQRLFYDQCHLRPEGHEIAGAELAKFLGAAAPL